MSSVLTRQMMMILIYFCLFLQNLQSGSILGDGQDATGKLKTNISQIKMYLIMILHGEDCKTLQNQSCRMIMRVGWDADWVGCKYTILLNVYGLFCF